MPTKTKEKPVKSINVDPMHKTISNLTDIVAILQNDMKRIKSRLGL